MDESLDDVANNVEAVAVAVAGEKEDFIEVVNDEDVVDVKSAGTLTVGVNVLVVGFDEHEAEIKSEEATTALFISLVLILFLSVVSMM